MSSAEIPNLSDLTFEFTDGRLLTMEEREALLAREDHGIQSAPMRQFETVSEFKQGQNNFYMTFTALPGRPAYEIYRGNLAVQRFQVLNPDLSDALDLRLRGKNLSELGDEDWAQMHQAYTLIANLVDINDPHVVVDGRVRPGALLS